MYNYCTLFDSNYLTRGLAMYESLKKYSQSFHLYVFAFDDKSYTLLTKLNLTAMSVISLNEFEDEELLKIKSDRTAGEYCWTCTPSIIKYSIETFNLSSCTYLDADLYFFYDPSILIDEMGGKSVLITEHRYTPEYDRSITNGIYCVQFMTFKNDENGMKVLLWWREACIKWCYARFEDNKFGDQKYLDDWLTRFDGVHELQNLAGGVAPWNIQQYDVLDKSFNLVFYHFHNVIFLDKNKVDFGKYKLKKSVIENIYIPYLKHLNELTITLKTFDNNDYQGTRFNDEKAWVYYFIFIKRKIKGNYNIFDIKKLIG